jgi:hypothetical protein
MNKLFRTLAGFISPNAMETPRSRRSPALRRAPRRWRPAFEALEGRAMLSTLSVVNNADSGPGSLRAELAAAQNGDTIVFAPSLNGQTIALSPSSGELNITKEVNIEGPGAGELTISGNNSSRVFQDLAGAVPVTISGLSIDNGNAVRFGLYGGAILNRGGALTISNCDISGNQAVYGGGIYNEGDLWLIASTLSQNTAVRGSGGGIYMLTGGAAVLTNCTLASNSADTSASSSGGAIYASYETLTGLVNCTIALNSAGQGGGIYAAVGSDVKPTNNIVAENLASTHIGADIDGTVYAADHNLVGNGLGENGIRPGLNGNIVGGFNGQPAINPMLGPLADNGGPTETMALLVGSPAIGHADNAAAPATDQRGVTRMDVPGEVTDIGAFEL